MSADAILKHNKSVQANFNNKLVTNRISLKDRQSFGTNTTSTSKSMERRQSSFNKKSMRRFVDDYEDIESSRNFIYNDPDTIFVKKTNDNKYILDSKNVFVNKNKNNYTIMEKDRTKKMLIDGRNDDIRNKPRGDSQETVHSTINSLITTSDSRSIVNNTKNANGHKKSYPGQPTRLTEKKDFFKEAQMSLKTQPKQYTPLKDPDDPKFKGKQSKEYRKEMEELDGKQRAKRNDRSIRVDEANESESTTRRDKKSDKRYLDEQQNLEEKSYASRQRSIDENSTNKQRKSQIPFKDINEQEFNVNEQDEMTNLSRTYRDQRYDDDLLDEIQEKRATRPRQNNDEMPASTRLFKSNERDEENDESFENEKDIYPNSDKNERERLEKYKIRDNDEPENSEEDENRNRINESRMKKKMLFDENMNQEVEENSKSNGAKRDVNKEFNVIKRTTQSHKAPIKIFNDDIDAKNQNETNTAIRIFGPKGSPKRRSSVRAKNSTTNDEYNEIEPDTLNRPFDSSKLKRDTLAYLPDTKYINQANDPMPTSRSMPQLVAPMMMMQLQQQQPQPQLNLLSQYQQPMYVMIPPNSFSELPTQQQIAPPQGRLVPINASYPVVLIDSYGQQTIIQPQQMPTYQQQMQQQLTRSNELESQSQSFSINKPVINDLKGMSYMPPVKFGTNTPPKGKQLNSNDELYNKNLVGKRKPIKLDKLN